MRTEEEIKLAIETFEITIDNENIHPIFRTIALTQKELFEWVLGKDGTFQSIVIERYKKFKEEQSCKQNALSE